MPRDTQDMFDINAIQDSVNAITERLDAAFESTARSLQEAVGSAPWLPESMKPSLKAPPLPKRVPAYSPGCIELSRRWVSEHRAATAAILAFVGTGAFIIWHHRKADRAKRRAKRAKDGAKTEVVVIAGSPHSPLTRSISLDLERRGFIVYIPAATLSEEHAIQAESTGDIKALAFDVTSIDSTRDAITKFSQLLEATHAPSTSATPYHLHLAAFILIPSQDHPVGGLANITPMDWSDALNSHLLAPFSTIHAFLPLLSAHTSSLLFLNPSITPSLASPSHAPENVVYGAMDKYASTLRQEYRSSVNVVQFKLGHFDLGRFSEQGKELVPRVTTSAVGLFDRKPDIPKGTPLRTLHNDVFDAIVRGKARNGTVFVGQGSRSYGLIGDWMPPTLVNWLVNLRRGHEPSLPRQSSEEHLAMSSEWESSMSP